MMKKFIFLLLVITVGSIAAMNCPPTLQERMLAKAISRRISCILGVSCECPAYLGKCRYFHQHINLLLELDRRELQMQERLDELNSRRLAEAQRFATPK